MSVAPEEVVQVIAHVLAKTGPLTSAIGGSLGFRVHGEGGGDWLLELAPAGGRWTRPADPARVERADTVLYAEAEAFALLLSAPGELEIALKSGTLAVDGDRTRLTRLGRLLAQGGSWLEARAARPAAPSSNHRRRKPCL